VYTPINRMLLFLFKLCQIMISRILMYFADARCGVVTQCNNEVIMIRRVSLLQAGKHNGAMHQLIIIACMFRPLVAEQYNSTLPVCAWRGADWGLPGARLMAADFYFQCYAQDCSDAVQ
jgi:hypothetical protein